MTTTATVVLLAVIAAGVVASMVHAAALRAGAATSPAPDLSFYQVAYLAGGRKRVALVAFAYLFWSGLLEIRDGSRTVALLKQPPGDIDLAPVEEAILARVPMEGISTVPVQGAAEVAAGWVADEMPDLVTPPRVAWQLAALAIVPALLALAASLALIVSLDGGESPGLLATVPFVALAVVIVAWAARPGVTRQGRAVLAEAADRYEADLEIASVGVTSLPVERGMYIVALYGRNALTGGLLSLRRVTHP
jgi:uncharacterized protein (TIGR04222 family)